MILVKKVFVSKIIKEIVSKNSFVSRKGKQISLTHVLQCHHPPRILACYETLGRHVIEKD